MRSVLALPSDAADLVVSGDHRVVTKLLFGIVGLDEAIAHGLRLDGDRSALDRLRPRAAA